MRFAPDQLAFDCHKGQAVIITATDGKYGYEVKPATGRKYLVLDNFLSRARFDMDKKVPWCVCAWQPRASA